MAVDPKTKKPKWAEYRDRTVDMSEVWAEEMDPDNEFGEYVEGCFSANRYDDHLRLEGMTVEDRAGMRFYDRDFLLRVFGESRVWHLEIMEIETRAGEW